MHVLMLGTYDACICGIVESSWREIHSLDLHRGANLTIVRCPPLLPRSVRLADDACTEGATLKNRLYM